MSEAEHKYDSACGQFLDRLDAWLAGEVPGEAGIALQHHHDNCAQCRVETRLARAIDGITRALPEHDLPTLTRQPPVQAAHRQTSPLGFQVYLARLLDTWRQPLVYAPALVLASLLALLLVQTGPAPVPQTVTVDGVEYNQEEILRAAADLELALRYLDKYGTIPARLVHAELQPHTEPVPNTEAPAI